MFAAGRLSAAEFAHRFGHMDAIFAQPWFARDLPAGAREMAAEYHAKTIARCKSRQFRELAATWNVRIDTELETPEPTAPASGVAAAPLPRRSFNVAPAVPVAANVNAVAAAPGGAAVSPAAVSAADSADGTSGISREIADIGGDAVGAVNCESQHTQHTQHDVALVAPVPADSALAEIDAAVVRGTRAGVCTAAAVEAATAPAAAARAQAASVDSHVAAEAPPARAAEAEAALGVAVGVEGSPAVAGADRLRNRRPTSPARAPPNVHEDCHGPEAQPEGHARVPAGCSSDTRATQMWLCVVLTAVAQAIVGVGRASWAFSAHMCVYIYRESGDRPSASARQRVHGNPRGFALAAESVRSRCVLAAWWLPALCICVAVIAMNHVRESQWGTTCQEPHHSVLG